MKKGIIKGTAGIVALIVALSMQSCFTGVEGTGKITLSKKEVAVVAPSDEDLFLSDISNAPIGDWEVGKRLLVTDEKLRFVMENSGGVELGRGDTLVYKEMKSRHGADGNEQTLLVFYKDGDTVSYIVDKNIEEASRNVSASDLAMLIDLDTVDKVKERLEGKQVWSRTALWYDEDLRYKRGRKYIPVTFTQVSAGDTFFPLKVKFTDGEGNEGYVLMNIGSNGNESRNFGKLFSLSDPRINYKHISDENWHAIQNESLRIGMTKEECRLSKGNPSDVDSGHDYSNTLEIWYYPNGSFLRFTDGVLVSFK